MTKNSKISKTSKKSENFSENSSETPAVQAKTSKKSPKISKKLLRQIGGKVPSIYTTQRGDLYCTYQKRKIYLGRDPKCSCAKHAATSRIRSRQPFVGDGPSRS